ncbi:MAG: endonuclease III [Bacteroidales bacterium]|nr:endonuclease III [Bacteroidales bacterium]MDE7071831.1 endonuclease III [Bacteroidales bacterium]
MAVSKNRAELFRHVLQWFSENRPFAESELVYRNPYELLVAVILSAQCTDKRVNLVTPALFARFPDPLSMSRSDEAEIFSYIRSVSYPNNKAAHLSGMAKMLVRDYGGEVPEKMDDLMRLPGVGRKTANVITAVAFGKPAMAVDTHVFRVSARIGLTVGAKTPLETERQLVAHIPEEVLGKAHHWLILHGRYVCTARNPKCAECGLTSWCAHYKEMEKASVGTSRQKKRRK